MTPPRVHAEVPRAEVVECEATPGEVVGRAVDLAVDLAFFTASTVAECIGAILGGRR